MLLSRCSRQAESGGSNIVLCAAQDACSEYSVASRVNSGSWAASLSAGLSAGRPFLAKRIMRYLLASLKMALRMRSLNSSILPSNSRQRARSSRWAWRARKFSMVTSSDSLRGAAASSMSIFSSTTGSFLRVRRPVPGGARGRRTVRSWSLISPMISIFLLQLAMTPKRWELLLLLLEVACESCCQRSAASRCSISVKASAKLESTGGSGSGSASLPFEVSSASPNLRISPTAGGSTPTGWRMDSFESSLRSRSFPCKTRLFRFRRSPSSPTARLTLGALSTGNISAWNSLSACGNSKNLRAIILAIMSMSSPFSLSLGRSRMCLLASVTASRPMAFMSFFDLQAVCRKLKSASTLKLPSILNELLGNQQYTYSNQLLPYLCIYRSCKPLEATRTNPNPISKSQIILHSTAIKYRRHLQSHQSPGTKICCLLLFPHARLLFQKVWIFSRFRQSVLKDGSRTQIAV